MTQTSRLLRGTLPPLIVFLFFIHAVRAQDTADDTPAIRATVLDYLEGWYEGDVDRMDKALHPELVKRIVYADPRSGRSMYNEASKTHMLEYTRAGMGKKDAKDKEKITLTILAADGDVAAVKSVTPQFIDYIHLARWNGEWKIINVLWKQNTPAQEK